MVNSMLCHSKKAKSPYEIRRVHKYVYSLEEVCFYLYNNIYLMDQTVMNRGFCKWVSEELKLPVLGNRLLEMIDTHESEENFLYEILETSGIYLGSELLKVRETLNKLKSQTCSVRAKNKADNLFESGELSEAILVYHKVLSKREEEEPDFYGKVYACLGTAYGKLFLYEEAAYMYERAWEIYKDDSIVKAYLYCCYCYMSSEQFEDLVSKNGYYRKIHVSTIDEIFTIKENAVLSEELKELALWKQNYRLKSN